MTTYRVDFAHKDDPGGDPTVIPNLSRTAALSKARSLSRTHGTAYAIARDDAGQDTGQRVYHDGAFSHQDDLF